MASNASKKRGFNANSQGSFRMNFRPPTTDGQNKEMPKGTKPTAESTSIKEIFTIMVLYICKKNIFFNTDLKVGLYLACLFFISIICDFVNPPKSYMSRSDNFLNQYFVKMAWGWNLVFLVPFCFLSSYVYCCGNKDKIVKLHMPRVVIATFFWFFWTKFFNIVESSFGKCNVKTYTTKELCIKNGFMWNGFDISGHSFILIYGSLVLIEECRSIINWESIKDYLRNEEHTRINRESIETTNLNPLRNLTREEFIILKQSYEKYTPYIRFLFISITFLQLLWDIMLIITMMYYHIMIEKLIGGSIAILTWFLTYRFWYKMSDVPPNMPGEGCFKYSREKVMSNVFPSARRRTGSVINGNRDALPRFMGMPLYGLRQQNAENPNVSSEEINSTPR